MFELGLLLVSFFNGFSRLFGLGDFVRGDVLVRNHFDSKDFASNGVVNNWKRRSD